MGSFRSLFLMSSAFGKQNWFQSRYLFHIYVNLKNRFSQTTGQKVYAHKAVLTARSDVMAAMFSGSFKESQAADIKEAGMIEIVFIFVLA